MFREFNRNPQFDIVQQRFDLWVWHTIHATGKSLLQFHQTTPGQLPGQQFVANTIQPVQQIFPPVQSDPVAPSSIGISFRNAIDALKRKQCADGSNRPAKSDRTSTFDSIVPVKLTLLTLRLAKGIGKAHASGSAGFGGLLGLTDFTR